MKNRNIYITKKKPKLNITNTRNEEKRALEIVLTNFYQRREGEAGGRMWQKKKQRRQATFEIISEIGDG